MLLSEFVKNNNLNLKLIEDYQIGKLTDDSNDIKKNDIFVIIKGINKNGLDYLQDVLDKGVKTVITEENIIDKRINVIIVKDVKNWYNNYLITSNNERLEKIKIIGVTGTNGKTTSCYLTYHILKKYKNVMFCGTNGTYVCVKNKEYHYNTNNTTPKLNVILNILNMHLEVKYLIIEVSSDAVENKRLGNLKFDILGLTNIGHDHINTHKTYSNYINAKVELFKLFKNKENCYAVLNDDEIKVNKFSSVLRKNIKKYSYGINKGDLRGDILSITKDHMMIKVVDKEHEVTLGTNLIGRFNVYNILLAIKISEIVGISFMKIIDVFAKNIIIDGRYNRYKINNRDVFIDYAHNPEAIKEFLLNVRQINKHNIITVIGAGGCRDKIKRGKMGYYSSIYSTKVIFTEDSSRTEDVNEIIKDLIKEVELKNYFIEINRLSAISLAFDISEEFDTIVLLGMGNDPYGLHNEYTDYKVIQKLKVE